MRFMFQYYLCELKICNFVDILGMGICLKIYIEFIRVGVCENANVSGQGMKGEIIK